MERPIDGETERQEEPTPQGAFLLVYVTELAQIRQGLQAFQGCLPPAKDWVLRLISGTRYWVFDPSDESFAPNKFVGFAGMTGDNYPRVVSGERAGVSFGGQPARQAIENALHGEYGSDPALTARLRAWLEGYLGIGRLDGVNEGKWKFIRLPQTVDDRT